MKRVPTSDIDDVYTASHARCDDARANWVGIIVKLPPVRRLAVAGGEVCDATLVPPAHHFVRHGVTALENTLVDAREVFPAPLGPARMTTLGISLI